MYLATLAADQSQINNVLITQCYLTRVGFRMLHYLISLSKQQAPAAIPMLPHEEYIWSHFGIQNVQL